MTEDEAKTKRCCGGILMHSMDAAGLTVKVSDFCIASNCMAWRWTIPPTELDYTDGAPKPYKNNNPVGYCGLSGKP